jgi:DNA repair exonuclease SbcCD ATPase subunit
MNKLSFTRVEIKNFRSIKDPVALDIKPGLFSIEGVNNDEASYNGAGKSSIISALYWCLTGNALTNEVLADEVINTTAGKDCKVTVFINSDKDLIKITRTRKDSEFGNNLILEVNEQNLSCHKITDTQERINQIIRLPLDLIRNTLILTSGMDSAFSELTPAQRVQVLENIRDYSVWNDVRDNANKDIKNYNKSIKEIELEISNLIGSKSSYSRILEDTLNEKTKYVSEYQRRDYPGILKHTEESIKTFEKSISDLSKKRDELQTKIISADTTALYNKILELKNKTLNFTKEINTISNESKDFIQQANMQKYSLNQKLDIINGWFSNDTCPTCKRKLERTEEQTKDKNTEKLSIIHQIEEVDEKITSIKKDSENKIAKINTQSAIITDELNVANEEYIRITNEASVIPNQISALDKQIKELNTQLSNEMYEKSYTQNAINSYATSIKAFDDKYNKYTLEIDNLTKQIEEKEKTVKEFEDKRKLSTFFYDLLGPKGELRPYLLKKDIEYLNNFVHHYTSRLFKGTEVKLELEGNTIKILIETAEGIKKSISSLSGGEKKRVNLAIQLALYDLMQTVSQIGFNMLCLDEVETQMDPIGCQQLIDIITDKSSEMETVYWITNNDMVKENIVNKIVCVKTKGVTKIMEN